MDEVDKRVQKRTTVRRTFSLGLRSSRQPKMPDSVRHVDVEKFRKPSLGMTEILEKAKGLEDSLQALHKTGSFLWKVRSPQKWYRRRFLLDLEAMKVRYDPTRKIACLADHENMHLDVNDIWDVRKGWKTDTFNRVGAEEERRSKSNDFKPSVEENNCFSIIHGARKESLDLVAPCPDIADKWVRCIEYLINLHYSKKQERSYETWLRKKFLSADLDGNKCLSFRETMKLVEELNIHMHDIQAKSLFDEANTKRATDPGQEEVLDEDEFIAFYFKLLRRPEIEELFNSYSTTQGILKAHELCAFLQKEQSDYASASIEDCEDLIDTYEQSDMKKNKQMSCAGFLNMLLSQQFDIFEESQKEIYQDMNQPLSHYYIASSHNTYLKGNQLSGESSLEGYADAIRRGCRCVELDLWDGDDDGEPLITHGFTLTTKIPLKEVLEDVIKPYAFAKSKYPLILSLENHCTAPFQKRAASLLEEYLGDVLYKEEIDDSLEFLPSPNQLRCKILVKGKKPTMKSAMANPSPVPERYKPKSAFYVETPTLLSHKSIPRSYEEAMKVGLTAEMNTPNSMPMTNGLNVQEDAIIVSSEETKLDGAVISRMANTQITDDLSSLVNLVQAVHFNSFWDSKCNQKYYQMSSFSEAKAVKLTELEGSDFVDYNKRQLSRIYPAGTRTGSSNFDPIQFWNAGCQIVALNYQTEDISNYLNFARFVENGACGYVLKPEFLRNPKTRFDPNSYLKDGGVRLRMRIISGQHLPKAPGNPEIVDPYVEIRVIGLPQDKAMFATKHVQNNGFNPGWNETFETQIRCPELAFIYIRVKDYAYTGANMPLAHYAIPLTAICPGYRHIQLHDLKGEPLSPSTLFVQVSISKNAHI